MDSPPTLLLFISTSPSDSIFFDWRGRLWSGVIVIVYRHEPIVACTLYINLFSRWATSCPNRLYQLEQMSLSEYKMAVYLYIKLSFLIKTSLSAAAPWVQISSRLRMHLPADWWSSVPKVNPPYRDKKTLNFDLLTTLGVVTLLVVRCASLRVHIYV